MSKRTVSNASDNCEPSNVQSTASCQRGLILRRQLNGVVFILRIYGVSLYRFLPHTIHPARQEVLRPTIDVNESKSTNVE